MSLWCFVHTRDIKHQYFFRLRDLPVMSLCRYVANVNLRLRDLPVMSLCRYVANVNLRLRDLPVMSQVWTRLNKLSSLSKNKHLHCFGVTYWRKTFVTSITEYEVSVSGRAFNCAEKGPFLNDKHWKILQFHIRATWHILSSNKSNTKLLVTCYLFDSSDEYRKLVAWQTLTYGWWVSK